MRRSGDCIQHLLPVIEKNPLLLSRDSFPPDNFRKFTLDRNKSVLGKNQKNKKGNKNVENEVIYYNEDEYYKEIDKKGDKDYDKRNRVDEEEIPEWKNQDIHTI